MQASIHNLAAEVTHAVEEFSLSTACSLEVGFYIWMRQARFDETVDHWRNAPTATLKAEYATLARKRARTVLHRIAAAKQG